MPHRLKRDRYRSDRALGATIVLAMTAAIALLLAVAVSMH